jgi:hypothetical protein
MTMWYGGWGWCSVMSNLPAALLFWGAVFTVVAVALRSAFRWPSEGVTAARVTRSETDDQDFYRRLM